MMASLAPEHAFLCYVMLTNAARMSRSRPGCDAKKAEVHGPDLACVLRQRTTALLDCGTVKDAESWHSLYLTRPMTTFSAL